MTAHSASMRLLCAAAALAMLVAASASAQTIANPNKKIAPATAKPAANGAIKTAAKPGVRPAAKFSEQTSTDYWAINTDLGRYSGDGKSATAERNIISRQPWRWPARCAFGRHPQRHSGHRQLGGGFGALQPG